MDQQACKLKSLDTLTGPAAHRAAYCCFCCHQINRYISRSKLVEAQKAHWHEVVSQQLLLLSTTAATPYTTFFFQPALGVICIDSRCMATVLGDMFMQLSFSIKAPRSSLIYVCIKAPKIYSVSRVPVLQHRDAIQLQKHLPAGTWNDILETKNYGILKLELKRFIFLWGLLVWQVANHVLYNVFCLLRFGMLWELHALLAWMNGKCWNNCVTLLSGVSGQRILSCGFQGSMTHIASRCFYLIAPSLSFLLSPIHRSSYKVGERSSECP